MGQQIQFSAESNLVETKSKVEITVKTVVTDSDERFRPMSALNSAASPKIDKNSKLRADFRENCIPLVSFRAF